MRGRVRMSRRGKERRGGKERGEEGGRGQRDGERIDCKETQQNIENQESTKRKIPYLRKSYT